MDIYRRGIRPLLFSGLNADPEWVHQQSLNTLRWLDTNQKHFPFATIANQLERAFGYADSRLKQTLWGIEFANPVGLAAGFDKDGIAAGIWGKLGFGFAELGTVTYHPQPGNSRPRLFRLPEDGAALNRMGFNNQGSSALAERLERCNFSTVPLGINLGKSKITPLEEAASDYLGSFQRLQGLGDYFVVNVSSPNTPGLRSLQDKTQLSGILEALRGENQGKKPILVKISPDLEWDAIADVLDLAQTYHLAGIIATNTTIRRDRLKTQRIAATGKPIEEEAGGISGKPVRDRATEVIRFIHQQTQGNLPIIGVGGIFTPEEAWDKIAAGASLIQVYTGWTYQGPALIREILLGLANKLEAEGLQSISEVVGS
ncbi:quinone-dependent dihydroorotate dehydrogenase [Lusitaniella coriacea LEGE 07157]|uniref:Dihydroorotate dehydrogenase (quinone) n=1 Tax=Lusitaniella coriacea LEGE 07157 TaxID=945747 RepID=A0A8J7JDV5_9CYAN|nr:quinone-dependent dihydroorotate dehydrogenase [Lusitaniella coriacea]MBE9118495.1 quinone-dependent dihydroorotate dehydrogenase [Lusitaniella coriacea LEGE 07157]